MSDRIGLSRGDRNRNARLARLRGLLPLEHAIVGIDLADVKQAAVVTDHDSRVLARRRLTARAWELGELLDWAVVRAKAAGFGSVTVACEPTGHRWRVVDQLCAERGLALVCVQPLLVYRAREGEDLTFDKPRWDAARPCLRIVRAVFAALADQAGVIAHRPGALERAGLALSDWQDTHVRIRQTEARMTGVLHDLGLTELVTTIAGLTAVGAAAILAETGDPNRFATPRSLDWHAGLCPRDNASGGYQGKTSISGRGRPGLRVAAWRAVRAALPNNPVMAAKFTHLTTRDDNRLARQQARTACAAALLRWIHVVITRQVAWDPAIAAGATPLLRTAA